MLHPLYSNKSKIISKRDLRAVSFFAFIAGVVSFFISLWFGEYLILGICLFVSMTLLSFMLRGLRHVTFVDDGNLCWISSWTEPKNTPMTTPIRNILSIIQITSECESSDTTKINHQLWIEVKEQGRFQLPIDFYFSVEDIAKKSLNGVCVVHEYIKN